MDINLCLGDQPKRSTANGGEVGEGSTWRANIFAQRQIKDHLLIFHK